VVVIVRVCARACVIAAAEWLPRCRSERCRESASGLMEGSAAARRAVCTRRGGAAAFSLIAVCSSLPPMADAVSPSPSPPNEKTTRTRRGTYYYYTGRPHRGHDPAPPPHQPPTPFMPTTGEIFSTRATSVPERRFFRTVWPQILSTPEKENEGQVCVCI